MGSKGEAKEKPARPARSHRARKAMLLALASVAFEAVGLWRQGYGLGGWVIVSCRRGHRFSTIWLPGASLKAARFGWVRFQRCPVGRHWSFVKLVREADLDEEERRLAQEQRDLPVP